jgi:lipopolysaccharide biosynthesis regulator YciM
MAVRLDPGSSDAHYQLGQLYRKEGNVQAAEQELKIFQELKQKSSTSNLSAP